MKNASSKIPSWPALSKIGKSKLVISSYYWIVIVPILAKLLEKAPDMIYLGTMKINISLPFSWSLLYFSALSFSIATIMYSYKCPTFIKSFSSFDEFKEKGLSQEQMLTYLSSWIRNGASINNAQGNEISYIQVIKNILNLYCREPKNQEQLLLEEPYIIAKKLSIKNKRENDAFWHIKNLMSTDNKNWRIAISIFYTIGFFLLLSILLNNLWYVLNNF